MLTLFSVGLVPRKHRSDGTVSFTHRFGANLPLVCYCLSMPSTDSGGTSPYPFLACNAMGWVSECRLSNGCELLSDLPLRLMILIKGMIVACRSVFFTLMLLVHRSPRPTVWSVCLNIGAGVSLSPPRLLLIITFIFSIAFLELSSQTPLEQEYFQSIPTPGTRCGEWARGWFVVPMGWNYQKTKG